MRTQKVLADWFAGNGWPFAESTGAGRSGSDLTGMPGLAIEVKARSDLQPLAWLKQAEMNQGLPLVIFRPNGMGEESVGKWGAMLRVEVLTELLRLAGYGNPLDEQTDRVHDERDEDQGDETEQSNTHAEAKPLTKRSSRSRHEADGTR